MTSKQTSAEIVQLLETACASTRENCTDGQLLAQFLAERDEAAFALLMRRHGPMVLGVCRRILGNAADAEDAFQATFLVLVRKAASLRRQPVVGAWLHGVARRTALNARRTAAHRRAKEEAMVQPEAQSEIERNDWLPLLDEELSRLPEKYRLPIVLCDLESRTRREAAEQLGWREGTVAGRLARGRTLLARQLVRRGLTLSAGLASGMASACVPASLTSVTLRGATVMAAGQAATTGVVSAPVAVLVEGVLKSMLLTKLKIVGVLLLSTVLMAAVVSLVAYQTQAGEVAVAQPPDKTNSDKEPPKPGDKGPRDKEALSKKQEQKKERTIRPGDVLNIQVRDALPNAPIQGLFLVEDSGKVALGPGYGRVSIGGVPLEEAEAVIRDRLAKIIKDPAVSVTWPVPKPGEGELERRVQQLEKEVRELRAAVEELRTKAGRDPRDPRNK